MSLPPAAPAQSPPQYPPIQPAAASSEEASRAQEARTPVDLAPAECEAVWRGTHRIAHDDGALRRPLGRGSEPLALLRQSVEPVESKRGGQH
eukprot:scaffold6503_cov360-Prasinococcus_capsulatus_cf.AAC.2